MASDSILSFLIHQKCGESEDEENVYPGVIAVTGASEQPGYYFFRRNRFDLLKCELLTIYEVSIDTYIHQ